MINAIGRYNSLNKFQICQLSTLYKVNDWSVGDEIVIAATGDHMSFYQSEKRTIAAVSTSGYELTLTSSLQYRHLGVCTVGWSWADRLCTRAEVGLLTRNIVISGNENSNWTRELPECQTGGSSQKSVQICFQNRFDHEVGSDQFGSVLFLHKPTFAKIEFVEVTHAG